MFIVRTARHEDAEDCGRAFFTAFAALADHHQFARDFPSAEAGIEVAAMLLADPGMHGVVAEADGRFLGCNFIGLGDAVAGVGPIAVYPAAQGGVGRALMQAVMDRAAAEGKSSIRFAQAAYNNRSLCLYTKLGFRARGPLSVLQGPVIGLRIPGYDVSTATEADLRACDDLCRRVHGIDRSREVQAAVGRGAASIVRHLDRVTGYTTGIGFFGHAVAEDDQSLKAMIAGAPSFPGPGFIVPTENHDLLLWCLDNGLRLIMQMTLMSFGLYSSPDGAWLPSVLY